MGTLAWSLPSHSVEWATLHVMGHAGRPSQLANLGSMLESARADREPWHAHIGRPLTVAG